MAYRATVYRIMIASPGDVEPERRAAIQVIHDWNAVNSSDRQVVLLPLAWESHASPEMGVRPQQVINNQLLRSSDLLVAIFWTRLGSPTGVSPSGTVEEIQEHQEAGKPVMIYFSSVPVEPNLIDPLQLQAVREFKAKCQTEGLYQEYTSISEFGALFTRQLAQTVIRSFGSAEAGEQSSVALPAWLSLQNKQPKLNPAAHELLLEAARANGTIISVGTLGGHHVQAGSREFVEPGDPRSEAKWLAAVEELEEARFIEDRAHKGEVFMVTQSGYEYSDSYF